MQHTSRRQRLKACKMQSQMNVIQLDGAANHHNCASNAAAFLHPDCRRFEVPEMCVYTDFGTSESAPPRAFYPD
jgi:hypothetical protein